MDCIQTDNKAADLFGAGKHGFQAGNPVAGILATLLSPQWCNGVQEEILNVVRAGGLVPDGADLSQMLKAINILIALKVGGVGEVKGFYSTVAPAGWLKANGQTIGSAASGATGRANADTQALFTHLWTQASNTVLPILDSTGAASTRGASAAADFAANKRMPLPDARGEFLRGLDDGRGADPGRALGSAQASANLAHDHPITVNNAGSHNHHDGTHTNLLIPPYVGSLTGTDNTGSGTEQAVGAGDSAPIVAAGDHAHTASAGSTGGTESRPRNLALLYCISY